MPEKNVISPGSEATKKKKKTKLEKIDELESEIKCLKDENKLLKQQVQYLKSFPPSSPSTKANFFDEGSITSADLADGQSIAGGSSIAAASYSSTPDDRLKEAVRALKRVTMKQEMALSKLRSKAKERRHDIETKDRIIEKMHGEIKSLRGAYKKIRSCTNDNELKTRLVDLELQLANEKSNHENQAKELKRSKHDVETLQGQLEKAKKGKGMMDRSTSSRSVQSETSASSTNEDGAYVAKLKRELAKRIETIANLEFELETARDQVHEMKRNKLFDSSFPLTPAPGELDDFFNDDNDADDDVFWGDSASKG